MRAVDTYVYTERDLHIYQVGQKELLAVNFVLQHVMPLLILELPCNSAVQATNLYS